MLLSAKKGMSKQEFKKVQEIVYGEVYFIQELHFICYHY